ncbi:MAG TPA: PEP-CTERM sorting domain-containing protein [Rhizomicrobium sp.]|jgi:hypothetical protein|nr:PEP-CTERM sorting domain-containing protein [Rhizomicrobium sp.]
MLSPRNFLYASAAAAILIMPALPALAAPVLSASTTGAPAGMFYANFDNLAAGNAGGAVNGDITVSFTGDAQTVTGALSGQYAAPYLNGNGGPFGDSETGPDSTRYLSTGIGSVSLTFAAPQTYLGLLWGSVDSFNGLTLYNGLTEVASFTGADVTAADNGDQGASGTYYVNISDLNPFDRAVFTSGGYAFEFDNVAYNVDPPAGVPEPLTLSLFAAGLVGAAAMRKKARA